MSRLTTKCDSDEYIVGVTTNGGYDEDVVLEKQYEANNKLGKLEDLEEQLGCPLEVICKIIKVKQIYVQKFKKYVEVRNVVIYEEATRPYIEYFYREYAQLVKVKEVWIDDYKKTWWLKEDKSE